MTKPTRHHTAWRPAAGLSLVLAWLLCWVTLVSAQSAFPPLNGVVADDTGRVDAGAVASAAADLQKLSPAVKPLAVMVSRTVTSSEINDFGTQAATNYGFINNGVEDPNLFAIVVSLGGRQSIILYGDALTGVMTQQRGGRTVADIIRVDYLSPKLAAGDYTGAFADSFRQAAKEIDLFRNPPPAPTQVPSVVTNVDTSGIGGALIWIVGGLVILGALVVVGPMLYKRWRQAQETAARRRVLQDQLLQARNVTADMITNLDLPVDPNEQITYKFLALALERERPQQLADLRKQYDGVYDRMEAALARYETTNSGTYTTEKEMTDAISQYQWVQSEVKSASDFLEKLASLSKQVEEQSRAAPGEEEAAKKALAAAADAIKKLAAAAPDLHPIDILVTLRSAQETLTQAERALAAKPPLPLKAYDQAHSARTQAEQITNSVQSLASAYQSLEQTRAALASARQNGFKLPDVEEMLTQALKGLSVAAQRLEQGDAAHFNEALKAATTLVQQATNTIQGAIASQAANAQALDKLRADGESIKTLIQQGAQAFDQVDEYAESSWEDIRGNGTEAQRAADDAYKLWEEATALNTVSPQSSQDFAGAKKDLDEANGLLDRARTLIAAIFDRLKHLEESKRVANAEMQAAQQDIAVGHAFVSKYDPDISPNPDKLLSGAEESLKQAQAELANPKPDWIVVVTQARKANDLADQALAAARTEEEAMQARRQRATTLAQQATTSLSRATNFASVHRADINDSVLTAIKNAQAQAERGASTLARAQEQGIEDLARAQALDTSAQAFQAAQQAADEAYNTASTQFAAIESLRKDAYNTLQSADDTIRSTASLLDEHKGMVSQRIVDSLQSAIETMPTWRDGGNTQYLHSVKLAAQEAEQQARSAREAAEQEIESYRQNQSSDSAGDILGTLLSIGAVALSSSNSGRRRHGGWGGSSGGGGIFGGSSGGGGGGGSSSGGWGGGGSSSGSWGGGGSSSGSWGGGGSSSGGW